MRIVIDMQGAQTQSRFRGIGRYTTSLVHALIRAASNDDIHLVLNGSLPESITGLTSAFEAELAAGQIHILTLPTRISAAFAENRWRRRAAELVREEFLTALQPDVVLITSLIEGASDDFCGSIAAGNAYKTAVILYDLIPFLRGDDYLAVGWSRAWYAEKIEHAKRADLLLAISKYTQDEAVAHLGFGNAPICNISAGVSPAFRVLTEEERRSPQLGTLGIRQPYILHTGSIEGRKNIDNLVRAFAELPPAVRGSHQIVLAGSHHHAEQKRVRRLARALGVESRLVFPGHLTDEDLILLYNCCRLSVLPSLHEGFGLPALEAMACGAATIGSNRTSIPEVIGLEEALFDPTKVGSIRAVMLAALTNEQLRERLTLNAAARARHFSWQMTAERALHAMRAIVSNAVVQRSDRSDLTALDDRRYRKLINSLATEIVRPPHPTDSDLAEVAAAIAANREVTDAVARHSDFSDGPA